MRMSSLSKIGIGLSVVFICLLLALVAEIYYLLWWKRRIIRRKIEDDYNNPRREFIYHFCWKNPLKSSVNTEIPTTIPMQEASFDEQELQFHSASNEFFIGQPRFLFTINEETKEDLESEDGKSTIREGKRSLSDLLKIVESNATPPYLTPISSPHVFVTPPITPLGSCQSGVYNPFYEASNDAEFSKIVKTSPPPKFKFLRDAEEKLQRRILMFEQAKEDANNLHNNEQNDESFIKIIVAKNNNNNNNENDNTSHHYHFPHCPSGDSSSSCPSSSSQAFTVVSQHLPPYNRTFKNFETL